MAPNAIARTAPRLNVRGAFIRRTDFSDAILHDADLSFADASGAIFRGADFLQAKLLGTILKGADLSGARNLTVAQLREAIIDDKTVLPHGVRHADIASKAL